MKTSYKSIFIIVFFTTFILCSIKDLQTRTTGAPASSTGAPGERDCTTSGCHDDGTINSGSAVTSILTESGSEIYRPDEIYKMKIEIKQENIKRFGFEITAIDNDGSPAGKIIIMDSVRTQIIKGISPFEDRRYLTYTYYGTDTTAKGESEWSFYWQAPGKLSGPVTFYAAAVAANNDLTDQGDQVYTTNLKLDPDSLYSAIENNIPEKADIFYNSMDEKLFFMNINSAKQLSFLLYDLSGKIIIKKELDKQDLETGFRLNDLPKAVYIAVLRSDNILRSEKIIIK